MLHHQVNLISTFNAAENKTLKMAKRRVQIAKAKAVAVLLRKGTSPKEAKFLRWNANATRATLMYKYHQVEVWRSTGKE